VGHEFDIISNLQCIDRNKLAPYEGFRIGPEVKEVEIFRSIDACDLDVTEIPILDCSKGFSHQAKEQGFRGEEKDNEGISQQETGSGYHKPLKTLRRNVVLFRCPSSRFKARDRELCCIEVCQIVALTISNTTKVVKSLNGIEDHNHLSSADKCFKETGPYWRRE